MRVSSGDHRAVAAQLRDGIQHQLLQLTRGAPHAPLEIRHAFVDPIGASEGRVGRPLEALDAVLDLGTHLDGTIVDELLE